MVLATVGIGQGRWQLVASEGSRPFPRRACFNVGYKPGPSAPYSYVSTSYCNLPRFSSFPERTGGKERSVLGIALPAEVAQVHLDLGETGKRDVPLTLLSRHQARRIHVDRFRWGYLKVQGDGCVHEAVGYDASGRVVYREEEDPAAPCG